MYIDAAVPAQFDENGRDLPPASDYALLSQQRQLSPTCVQLPVSDPETFHCSTGHAVSDCKLGLDNDGEVSHNLEQQQQQQLPPRQEVRFSVESVHGQTNHESGALSNGVASTHKWSKQLQHLQGLPLSPVSESSGVAPGQGPAHSQQQQRHSMQNPQPQPQQHKQSPEQQMSMQQVCDEQQHHLQQRQHLPMELPSLGNLLNMDYFGNADHYSDEDIGLVDADVLQMLISAP